MPRGKTTIILLCLTVVQLVLLVALRFLARENSQLKHDLKLIIEYKSSKAVTYVCTNATNTKIYARQVFTNKYPRPFLPSEVTILLLKKSDSTLNAKIDKIRLLLPKSPIKFVNTEGHAGESLNHIISEVRTDYFILLEAEATFSDRASEGIDSLWDILERYPEVDFIGGSYLHGEKLYVSCQRFKLCKWTLKESYEYQRSLDNAMICEGTSQSFMGRTKSVSKVQSGFDEKISDLLVVKDFFIRAKSVNIVVATLPSFILVVDKYESMYDMWQSRDITKQLVPFAVKYKVLVFEDEESNRIELCASTSPIRGKNICFEPTTHKVMLDGGHWAPDGLYAYSFLMEYLKISLHEVIKFLEEHNVNYTVSGGVSLGAIKMHSIIPWDAGDIDMFAYGLTVPQLYGLMKPWGDKMGYIVRVYQPYKSHVHIFCTPKEVGDVSGGLVTIRPLMTPAPKYMRVKTEGIWVRYERDLFQKFYKAYGKEFLTHRIYRRNTVVECKKKGHNACLPNFNLIFNGKGGTYKDYFCES